MNIQEGMAGKPMRVALFSRNARSADAIGQQVSAKLSYFQQLGAEVRLYLSEGKSLRPEAAALSPVIGSAKQIWRTEREYLLSCDLVMAEYGAAYDLMDLLPALSGQGPRLVVDYRGVTPVELGDDGLKAELEAAARQRTLLWCADAVLVQSEFAARELVESTGFPRERIHLIPCWMAKPLQMEAAHAAQLRKKHQLTDCRIALFVGRLARNKQPGMLVEALQYLPREVQAVFVGCQEDAYREQLQWCRQRAKQLGVGSRVHFMGSVSAEELAGWYGAADVLVLPSRHECFGMPVVEAMLRGTPVVATDAGSLPEVLGHAGLSTSVDDPQELATQVSRMLGNPSTPALKRVALVTHRFGTHFAGGAEKSLRLMAGALKHRGYAVEVFTTCNEHESQWANTLQAGTVQEDGFLIHRFPIDAFDADRLGRAYESIRYADGRVSDEVQQQYLNNSLGSQDLLLALETRREQFAAIITGPYLFRLIHDVVARFGEQVLLAGCFHDEPLARLPIFCRTYRGAGGLLFHTEEEATLAAERLKINQPRHAVIGTVLPQTAFLTSATSSKHKTSSPYVVYCGRYCPEKGLDRLLEYMEELNQNAASQVKLVCLGQGPMKLPRRPWLVDRGFVSEEVKREVLSGALCLVNLSRNESLSIVALEAWALSVPVVVDGQCAVLRSQVERSKAGVCVTDAEGFCKQIHRWLDSPELAAKLGQAGRAFALREYGSEERYGLTLEEMVASLQKPLSEIAGQQGMLRATSLFDAHVWSDRLSTILEQVQVMPVLEEFGRVRLEPLQDRISITQGIDSSTVTLRIINSGTKLLASTGPAKVVLKLCVVTRGKRVSAARVPLSAPLPPGQEQLVTGAFEAPGKPGNYRIILHLMAGKRTITSTQLPMKVTHSERNMQTFPKTSLGSLAQTARSELAQAKRLEQLPADYVDVCEGKLAGLKRTFKRKLLNNFRKAYVDVAFRQQSVLNEKLIAVMSLLLESQSAQDIGGKVAEMQLRIQRLEKVVQHERRKRRSLQRRLRNLTSPDISLMEGDGS